MQDTLKIVVDSDRQDVIERYKECLQMLADPSRGKSVFQQHCASCHSVAGVGVHTGPDISDSRTVTAEQLLVSILDPNRVIDNNYFRYIALTENDDLIEGIIQEETSDRLILLGQDAKRTIINRRELVQLNATGQSLMPAGLEMQIDTQAMADLIAFIKGWRYMDGTIPQTQ